MLKFTSYLPEHGWLPVVLSASPKAYAEVSDQRLGEIPGTVPVSRPFALDAARHLAIGGRHFKWTALPDRWISWCIGAIPTGLRLLRKHKPRLIWSTYPIATAHLIGLALHRVSGIPWIADFRDLMTEDGYPVDPTTKKIFNLIERWTIKHCDRAVFTTQGTLRMYSERYPGVPHVRWAVIPNGYDEDDFTVAERLVKFTARAKEQVTLVHSGVLYPSDRDPSAFFSAVADLQGHSAISASTLKIVFRGAGNEAVYRREIERAGIDGIVKFKPLISYHEALAEILTADGLLIFQASNCNNQIPAKVYECLRARRPILALTDPVGDTAYLLRESNIDTIVPLDSKEKISLALIDFLARIRAGSTPIASAVEVQKHSRRSSARELARLLESVT
jgi:glycosyltransferase involved in cell wall biosynthesis